MRSQQMLRRNHPKKTAAILLILSCIIAVLPTLPLYAQKADTDEITIVREETDRRTASEKHYLCSDGSVMAVSFSGDVHYMDENGKYQTIDNTLSYNAAKGQYRSTGNPGFKVSFGASANQPEIILEDGRGNTLFSQTTVSHSPMSAVAMRALSLQPAALSLHNETKAEVKGMSKDADEVLAVPGLHAQLNYENAFGSGISAQYALDGNSLKENIVFEYPTSYHAIVTQYTMEGMAVEADENGALILYNNDWEAVYTVDAPYMYDAAGAECPSIAVSIARQGDSFTVSYVPDAAWRNSEERVYPVVFDPLILNKRNDTINDEYSQYTNDVYVGVMTDTELRVGMESYSTEESYGLRYRYRTFIDPVYPTIPVGNTVASASLVLTTSLVVGNGYILMLPMTGGGSFEGNDYTLGAWFSAISYNSSMAQTTYSFTLPNSEFTVNENGEITGNRIGYVLQEEDETVNPLLGAHYVVFNSSRATKVSQRPVMKVTYMPQGISNKITTLYNPATEHYLSVTSESTVGMTAAPTSKSQWKIQPAGTGSFRIVSQYFPEKCLGTVTGGGVTLVDNTNNLSDESQLWYLTVADNKYTIRNEETGWQLLATENSEGELICRVATHTSSNKNEWQMIDLPAAITESVSSVTLYNAETARYLTAVTDSSVAMTVAASTCSQWHILIIEGTSSCRIMSQYYSNKCLAADADGNLSIAAIDNSNNAQRWYVTCTNGVYSIVNEQYSNYLYTAEDASGNISCGAGKASAEEQKSWNYSTSIPDVIVTLSGVGRSDAYLNNVSGLNYDGEKLGISTYDDSDGYDRFGFRLVYLPQTDAYKILPISSCNGNYRVLTNDGPGAIVSIYSYSENSANQKFNLELQSDGTYVISLKSDSSSVLTIYQNHAIMSTRSSSLTNQKWELELYQYTSPQSVDSSTSGNYIDVETYYKSLGFRSPFRNIQKDSAGNIVNVSDGSVTVTSDFGKRLKSLYDEKTEQNVLVDDSHEGLDISGSEGTPLFGVSTGRVVYIDDIPNSASGRFIIVETDYYEYQSNGQQTGRKIYYIYMHMQSISVALNTEITDDNIDTLELGKVGCSGYGEYTYSAHLHLGVFLADAGLNDEFSTYQPWVKNVDCNSAINPLLFLVPNNCSIIRTQP